MSLKNLKFKKIKKINNHYIQKACLNDGGSFQFSIPNFVLSKNLYKNDTKIYVELSFEKNDKVVKIFNILKQKTIETVWEQHKTQVGKIEDIQQNYINDLKETDNNYIVKMEVNKYCQFNQINQFDEYKNISYTELQNNVVIDTVIHFNGILYGKSNFTNNFIITKITKHIEEMDIFEEDRCYIETESDNEEDMDIDDDYMSNLNNKFQNMCINIEDIPEYTN